VNDTPAGSGGGNYPILQGTLALPDGFPIYFYNDSFSITRRPATVTAGDASKVFGTSDPVIGVSASNFLPADEALLVLSVSRVAGENAGTYSTIPAVSLNPSAVDDVLRSYQVGYAFGKFTITKAPVTVSAVAAGIIYGSADPAFRFTYSPLPGGMVVGDIDASPVCGVSAPHVNAGSYPIACSGAADNNLTFVYNTEPFTVAPKTVTLAINSKSRAYGVANPALDAVASGVLAGDTLNYTLSTTANALSPIGSYPITAALGSNPNYVVQVTGGTLNISLGAVTITANPKTKVYGNANPALDAVIAGLAPGDTLQYSLSTPATPTSAVGGYPITVSAGINPNYVVTVVNSTLIVTPRPIAVTANPLSMTYGGPEPALSYAFAGGPLVGTDTFTGGLSRAPGTGASSYPISRGTLALNANYTLSFTGANLTISPKAATVTAGNAQKVVDQLDPVLTVTGSGFLTTDVITLTVTRAAGEAAGTYLITPLATGTAVGNYIIAYTSGMFTIISDNRPPVCGKAYGGEIWPPNHKRFYVAPVRGVLDPEGGAVTILVTGIWQDEQIDSTGDGQFSPDGNGIGTSTAWVRAERNGHQNKAAGNGRVYEILFTATDNRGAQCTGSVLYGVPHDQGQRPEAIDSGMRYDSTGVVPGARDKSQIHQNSPRP